jgi:exopolysaccharide production protein ExoQ
VAEAFAMPRVETDVLSDHVTLANIWQRVVPMLENTAIVILILIQSSFAISFPTKLMGGPVPGIGLIWALAGALCVLFALTSALRTLKAMVLGLPFVMLGMWIALSNLWTITPYETLRGTLLYLAALLFAAALAQRVSWDRLIGLLAWTLNALVAASVVIAVTIPSLGQMQGELQGAWSGVWLEKQALGFYASLALICALAMVWRGPRYWYWWLAIGMCVIAILGSTGVTAIGMAAIGVATALWLRLFYHDFSSKLTGSWLAALAGIAAVPALMGAFDIVLRITGKTSDLSGRREIWEGVTTVANMRPMEGWGFQSIWRTKDDMTSPLHWILERAEFVPANAHSSWLDMYLQLGQVGVILLGLCMFWVWGSLIVKSGIENRHLAFAGAVFAAITFISFSETNLVMPMDLQWTLAQILSVKILLTPTTTSKSTAPIQPHEIGQPEDENWFTYQERID